MIRSTPWFLALALAVSTSLPFRGTAQDSDRSVAGQTNDPAAAADSMRAEDPDTNGVAAASEADAQADTDNSKHNRHRGSSGGEPVVIFGSSYVQKAGETAQEVVVIGGSATIHGKVTGDVVTVGGDITADGDIGGDAVAVLGGLTLLPGAKVGGDAVGVGGKVDVAEGATVSGTQQGINIGFGNATVPGWLKLWLQHSVFKLRPMAPQVPWLWALTAIMFLIYLLIVVVFPHPVQACVEELTRRPATTFLMGLLTKLLLPLVLLILAITGLGVFVIPFVLAALFLGAIVGKAALFVALGQAVLKPLHSPAPQRPVIGLMVGFLVIILLYMIPVIGLLALMLTSLWGLGVAVLAAFSGLRKETTRPHSLPPREAPVMPMAPSQAATMAGAGFAPGPSEVAAFSASPTGTIPGAATPPQPPPNVQPEATIYPRASFWSRMGAAFLDIVLVSLVTFRVGGPPLAFLVALAYFAGMWTWKGTTVGGIVLGLKVVRLDGGPVTFAVALVRSLGAAFSGIVLFLGFLWIAWDPEKQGWHDRIAGTVVVKLPRGTSLVCI
jgi:uncharacterized RDD family membrane protein YckC